MIYIIILWWLCNQLIAPTWCYVLLGAAAVFKFFDFVISLVNQYDKK